MAERYSTDEVQALADEFIRFKRYVEDALENLPDMGMTESSVKKLIAKYGETSSAGFEAFADADEAIAKMFAEYKKEINGDINDLQIRSSSIEAKADANSASITGLAASVGDNKTNIAMIEQNSNASGAFISLMAMSANKSIDTTKGYTINDVGDYVFKDFNGNDVVLNQNEIAGIYISSINQGVESSLTSIKLNADVVEFGNYASVDSSGNFYATRIFGHGVSDVGEYPGAYFADITSTMAGSSTGEPVGGDFCIRKVPGYSDGIIRDNEDLVYGLMFDKTLGEDAYSVNFVVGSSPNHDGHSVWGYNYGQGKFYPKGEWDFSSCKLSNIPLYFS